MERTRAYRDLVAWQKAMDLVETAYRLAKALPREEMFGLAAQIRRAAVSVPANIAEGQSRRGPGEFVHFLGIARGSLAELDTLLEMAQRVRLLPAASIEPALAQIVEVRRILQGLITAVERHSASSPGEVRYRAWLSSHARGHQTPISHPPSPISPAPRVG